MLAWWSGPACCRGSAASLGDTDPGTCAVDRSHEEETQWTQCIVDYFTKAGCGNLTATEIADKCGAPINSNSTVCLASPHR